MLVLLKNKSNNYITVMSLINTKRKSIAFIVLILFSSSFFRLGAEILHQNFSYSPIWIYKNVGPYPDAQISFKGSVPEKRTNGLETIIKNVPLKLESNGYSFKVYSSPVKSIYAMEYAKYLNEISNDPKYLKSRTYIQYIVGDRNAYCPILEDSIVSSGNDKFISFRIRPYILNLEGQLEKVDSIVFKIGLIPKSITEANIKQKGIKLNKMSSSSSVFGTGDWYKLGYQSNDIFRLDYNTLKTFGVDVDHLKKSDIRIYGGESGVLPQVIKQNRDADLTEIPIYVSGNGSDNFTSSDEVIFYAKGPHSEFYDRTLGKSRHGVNIYSDTAYVFLSIDPQNSTPSSRISSLNNVVSPEVTVDRYLAFQYHELDQANEFIKQFRSGREWFGEEFDRVLSYDFNISFLNRITDSSFYYRSDVVARSINSSTITSTINNNNTYNQSVKANSFDYLDYFAYNNRSDFQGKSQTNDLSLNLTYDKPLSNSIAWLNYFEFNAWCKLDLSRGRLRFIAPQTVGKKTQFNFLNGNQNCRVFRVSQLRGITEIKSTSYSNNLFSFIDASSDTLNPYEYMVFDGSSYGTINLVGKIANQNLHGVAQPDFVLLYHPDFAGQAQKLADFHRKRDNLKVLLVTPQQIYNEFSYGRQDISAIRDFLRVLYKRNLADSTINKVRYLGLFGDASFDYKNKLGKASNFVPIYQSPDYLDPLSSYATDDYYGFLDDNEGYMSSRDILDISIGRMPINTAQQGEDFLNKINHYVGAKSLQPWKLSATYVADDEDGNTYFSAVESLTSGYLKGQYPILNIDKYYLDAFKQISTPSGDRYPDVNVAINNRLAQGTLSFNWTGHGSENGIAHEKVITRDMVTDWTNLDGLPVFVTASCEISRYDDPTLTSIGELVFLNPKGGAIGLMSTTRVVNSAGNEAIADNIYENNMFERDNYLPRTFGDIIHDAKNRTGNDENTLKFALLGDPALRIGLPQDSIITTSVNGKPAIGNISLDTLKALQTVTFKGYIKSTITGLKLDTFNGTLYPTVFDKEQSYTTLANDPTSYRSDFKLQNNIIYKGQATIKNGEWSFSFTMPKDISYTFSKGKISYYAQNGNSDAAGVYSGFKLGSSVTSINNSPPKVRLFINDTNFRSGGITNQNPILIAKLSDDQGINTVGLGIGHEITAYLNDSKYPDILNAYYTSNLNDSRSGIVKFNYSNLTPGHYKLLLRCWDISNNPGTGTIEFEVKDNASLNIANLKCYPNPVTNGQTILSFEHNGNGQTLDVAVYVNSIDGKLIRTIKAQTDPASSLSNTIKINLTDDGGTTLSKGVYFYTVVLTDNKGNTAKAGNKLVYVGE